MPTIEILNLIGTVFVFICLGMVTYGGLIKWNAKIAKIGILFGGIGIALLYISIVVLVPDCANSTIECICNQCKCMCG